MGKGVWTLGLIELVPLRKEEREQGPIGKGVRVHMEKAVRTARVKGLGPPWVRGFEPWGGRELRPLG